MLDQASLKSHARSLVLGGTVSPLLVSAVVFFISELLDNISFMVEYHTTVLQELRRAWEMGENYTMPEAPAETSFVATFIPILILLLMPLIQAGYKSYCMGIYRGEHTGFSALLDGLGIAGKVIWCDIQMSVRIMLWSMLFVLPGFIAIYRYRFAVYNLLSNPSLSVGEAIALSCRQTDGMKMELFFLDLSFLGWHVLSFLTFGLLDVWLMPYLTFTELGCYDVATRNVPVPGPEPDSSEPET